MKNRFLILIVSMLIYSINLTGQSDPILLTLPVIDLNIPDDCLTVRFDTELDFILDPTCGGNVRIEFTDLEGGVSNVYNEQASTLPYRAFSYLFAEPGSYVIFCNAASTTTTGAPEVEDSVFCVYVPEIVPTLGEWSVILLFLLLTIVMVTALVNQREGVLVLVKK